MFETPAPSHGFVPVLVVFWLYVGTAVGVALGATALGASSSVAFLVFLVAALALLTVFLPLFRRFAPSHTHETA